MRKLLLALALAGCTLVETIGPEIPPSAVPLGSPGFYPEWWAEVAACSGVTDPPSYDDITWWLVPGGDWYVPAYDAYVAALWFPRNIYIGEGFEYRADVVKHEMLHELGFSHRTVRPPYSWPFSDCVVAEDAWPQYITLDATWRAPASSTLG